MEVVKTSHKEEQFLLTWMFMLFLRKSKYIQ